MRGGDSSSHRAEQPNKSSARTAHHPSVVRKLGMNPTFPSILFIEQ